MDEPSSHTEQAEQARTEANQLLRCRRFGTIINAWDLESLDEQLQCLEPYVPMMRMAMRDVWQRMLYSNAYDRSYLGEDRHHDAMHTIMQVSTRHWFPCARAPVLESQPRRDVDYCKG